jgi:dephospho-CoA kinase
MKTIGLTGGIGSGKSTIANFFSLLGIPIYKADDAAKILMATNLELRKSIVKVFGKEAYTKQTLNRAYIAQMVFSDAAYLEKLNAIVHPSVRKDFRQWAIRQKGSRYLIREAAILFESGSNSDCDKVITVYSPENERIKRVSLRNGLPSENIVQRIRNQWPDEKKIALADFVIQNYGNHLVIPQILKIHQTLLDEPTF